MVPVVFPDPASLWLFCLAALALLAIPGPAVLYIVARSSTSPPQPWVSPR
jgi:threonine/homoserine/homoserine lactone efflux protein